MLFEHGFHNQIPEEQRAENSLTDACNEPGQGKGALHGLRVINFLHLCKAHDPIP